VQLPSDLHGKALEAHIVARANETGLDTARPSPVRMKGTLFKVNMHIIAAFNPSFKGHGSGHAMAEQEDIAVESIEGEVVGFYAPPTIQGTFTHPGEPFHFHWVDSGRTRTAHLDAFGMRAGALLQLPAR
jgi:alpha-acetolactate decarboxylase